MGELLTPTLAEHRPRDWAGRLPFRLSSQVYVAILGGPIALTIVALVNGRRLRMERHGLGLVLLAGVVATALALIAYATLPGEAPRLGISLAGLLAFGAVHLLQRSPDRVHSTFSPHADPEEDYESLLPLGVAAVVVGLVAIVVLGAGA